MSPGEPRLFWADRVVFAALTGLLSPAWRLPWGVVPGSRPTIQSVMVRWWIIIWCWSGQGLAGGGRGVSSGAVRHG